MTPTRMLVPAVALALAGGCSAHVGTTRTISRETLAGKVQQILDAKVGQKLGTYSCPRDVELKEGATTRCVIDDGSGQVLGVTVTLSQVKGSDARINAKADAAPMPSPTPSP